MFRFFSIAVLSALLISCSTVGLNTSVDSQWALAANRGFCTDGKGGRARCSLEEIYEMATRSDYVRYRRSIASTVNSNVAVITPAPLEKQILLTKILTKYIGLVEDFDLVPDFDLAIRGMEQKRQSIVDRVEARHRDRNGWGMLYMRQAEFVIGNPDRDAYLTVRAIEDEIHLLRVRKAAREEFLRGESKYFKQPPNALEGKQRAKEILGLYARRAMADIGSPSHLFLHLALARATELLGGKYETQIAEKISPGALRWQIAFDEHLPSSRGFYFLGDLRPKYKEILAQKRGGTAIEAVRFVCTISGYCVGGYQPPEALVLSAAKARVGIRVYRKNGIQEIEGLSDHLWVDGGTTYAKLENGWKEIY